MFYKDSSDSSFSALNLVTMYVSKTNSRDCQHKERNKRKNVFYHMNTKMAKICPYSPQIWDIEKRLKGEKTLFFSAKFSLQLSKIKQS